MSAITPLSKAQQALAAAKTPQETKQVEALAAAAKAWAKEQDDFGLAFDASVVYILAMCKTTELIEPEILHGSVDGYGNRSVTLADYGFTKMQWNRRCKILEAVEVLDDYQDDCIEKQIYPTPYGLIGYYKGNPHVSHNSGSNEWYTPSEIIEAARSVMGGIDTDPASSDKANDIVKAGTFYTIDDDGLIQDWNGNIWLNPPYEAGLVDKFASKFVNEYEQGRISQSCVLVNNATETKWFRNFCRFASAVCFPAGRIRYYDEYGNRADAPLQGQAIIYTGDNVMGFTDMFESLGMVLYVRCT